MMQIFNTTPFRRSRLFTASTALCAGIALLLSLPALHRVLAQTAAPQAAATPQAATPPKATPPPYPLEAKPEFQNPNLPNWAYTPQPPRTGGPRPPDDGTILHVPGSDIGYTRTQINDGYGPPDWFPAQHPPAPVEATHGRKPAYRACGLCHLISGYGRPENQSIAGLPAEYIRQQIEDFKNDRRYNSVPGLGARDMIPVAKNITPEEIEEVSRYYASITPPAHYIRVVETDTVPKTHAVGRVWQLNEDGGTEPIGNRIIETPEDAKLVEMRDSGVGFVAYVPKGSITKGAVLVRTGGNGKTLACATCHGMDLHGLGTIPGLAGRSPSQLGRQIYDFKTGARNGANAPLMKPVVAKLTDEDVVNIMAYLASLPQS